MTRKAGLGRLGRRAFKLLAGSVLLGLFLSPTAQAQEANPAVEEAEAPIRVRQRTSDTVYLDAGRKAGLLVGQRLKVLRGETLVAELEVSFLSSSSASCRIVESFGDIEEGDSIIPGPRPQVVEETGFATSATSSTSAVTPGPRPTAPEDQRREARARRQAEEPTWGKLVGNISLRFQSTQDDLPGGRDFDQSTVRVSLAARNLGGTAHELRLRARGREDQRTSSKGTSESRRNDRLYELSLSFEPEGGRLSYFLGRLSSGPLVGFDYLDGALAEFRLTPRNGIGAFYGNRSDIEEFGLADVALTSYGAYFRHVNRQRGRPYYSEILVGAVGEYRSGEVNREYLSVYGRQGSGSRWSLYERVEVDFNRDWRRETASDDYQFSNLLLSASYRFSPFARVALSYDQRQRFRELDDRDTPEERFDDQLRQGARLTTYLGPPRGIRFTGSVGLRRREGSSEDNLTLNGSLFHANVGGWGLFLGADFGSFSGETSEGSRYGVRVRKYLGSGHDLGITIGTSTTTLISTGVENSDEWIRLSGTAQLPKRLFLLGEYELSQGDTLEGQRYFLQLGYRF